MNSNYHNDCTAFDPINFRSIINDHLSLIFLLHVSTFVTSPSGRYNIYKGIQVQQILPQMCECRVQIKGKAAPLQAWSGPEGSRKLRFPDFMTTAQDGGKVVNLTHRPPLPPGNTPGTHFCWDRGSTVVKVLCYKSEGLWFDSRWCHWNFSLT